MRTTTLGRNGPRVSRLGFGCMRLPMTPDGKVDRAQATPLLRNAVELGVTYIDTAIFYCNGDSQRAVGEALIGLRDRVVLSTKNHCHEASDADWWKRLEESLEFLQTDHLDCYNFHGITWDVYERLLAGPAGKLRLMEKAREQGKVRHICCSFHDEPASLVKLIETGLFTAITVQYNLLNRSLERAMDRAAELGVGIVVMGPVGGGRLGVPSERIRELTGQAVQSTPEAALRFVLAHPAVSTAISGMSTPAMLEDNVRIVSETDPFTPAQIAALDGEMARIKERTGAPCTACGYCLPCPYGVDIPGNFQVFNEYKLFGFADHSRAAYKALAEKAAVCAECGACRPRCPQKIDIPTVLRRAVAELDPAHGDFGTMLSPAGPAGPDSLRVRLTCKNFRTKAIHPRVRLELEDDCRVEPALTAWDEIPASSAAIGEVRVKVPDGVGALRGRCVTQHGETVRETPVALPFFIVPRDRFREHRARFTDADFGGDAAVAAAHGLSVALRHDADGITARLDVRSQLHTLAKPGETSGARIELYVDMRPADRRARDLYEDGVDQIFLSLGAPEFRGRFHSHYALNLRREPTAAGCRFQLDLRFADFLKPGEPVPERVGLDWMLVVFSADGRELGHPTNGGRQGLWQHPRFFTPAFLL